MRAFEDQAAELRRYGDLEPWLWVRFADLRPNERERLLTVLSTNVKRDKRNLAARYLLDRIGRPKER